MPFSSNPTQRVNIKSRVQPHLSSSPGNLHDRFRPYFDILISPENIRRAGLSFDATYVPVPEIENALEDHIKTLTGQITVLTGNRGIGKSTILRRLFGNISTPSLSNKRLIIPFLLDATNYSNTDDSRKVSDSVIDMITGQLDAAADELTSSAPSLVQTEDDFYNFIKSHAPRLLKGRRVPTNTDRNGRLELLKSEKPYAYYAELIKFRVRHGIAERIILIIDNIEHIDANIQRQFVESVISLRNCFYNTKDSDLDYIVDIVLTCRPETLEYFRHNGNMKGWTPSKRVSINQPVEISTLIEKRLNHAVDLVGSAKKGTLGRLESVADVSSWSDAYHELLRILNALSDRHGKIVVELANLDLRQAMDFLFHTLKNSRWFFHGPQLSEGAFDIKEADYRASYAGFFRALVLRDCDVYSSDNEVVGNLLYNTEDEPDADLMCAYIALYMKKYAVRRAISREQIIGALSIIFDGDLLERCVEDRIRSMENSGLIYSDRIVYENRFRGQEGYLATERLVAIINGLKASSMFLEFFRDDVWADVDAIGEITPTSSLVGRTKFMRSMQLISQIVRIEKGLVDKARSDGRIELFEKYFGNQRICGICLEGLSESLGKYYKDRTTNKIVIPKVINDFLSKLNGAAAMLSMEL